MFLGFPGENGIEILNSTLQYGLELNSLFLILNDSALDQSITTPTHENSILDLVLTTDPDLISELAIVPGMSDHEAVFFTLSLFAQSNIPLLQS